ncbi:hypothetical protein PMAYCL1PPCAC_03314, partial [Pristionchus mayeri]
SDALIIMWERHYAELNVNSHDIDENHRTKATAIYKCLTVAFVLKQSGKLFLQTEQSDIAGEYENLSRCFQNRATLILENCRKESISFAMALVNTRNQGQFRPKWALLGMHEIAYQGEFVNFLNHRVCVLVSRSQWKRSGSVEKWWHLLDAPRVAYYLHLVTFFTNNLFFKF